MPSRSSSVAQGRRIVVDRLGQVADLGRDVRELGLEPGQAIGERLEPLIEPAQAAGLAQRDRRRLAGTGALRRQGLVDRRRSPGDRLAMLGCRQARPDLVGLARSEPGGGDLGGLVLEQVEPAGQLARLDGQLGQRRPVCPPALDGVGHRGSSGAVPAERVEQVALPSFVEQALLVVLAVDLDERADLVRQPRGRRREVVEPRRRATADRHLADRDQRLGQAVEQRLDASQLGPVADQRRVGARARSPARARRSAGSCRRRSRR